MLYNGIEYFGVGKYKDVLKQIEANPLIQIVGCEGAEWIRISGTAVFDDDPVLFGEVIKTMPFLANLYNEETGKTLGIFRLEQAQAQFYVNMMELEKTIEF